MVKVYEQPYCLRDSSPSWLSDVVAAIEAINDKVFFDDRWQPLKVEVKEFDNELHRELSNRFKTSGVVQRNVNVASNLLFSVDMCLPTQPKTLLEIQKGQLPRLELDLIKFQAAIFRWPEQYGYACIITPVNYIRMKLASPYSPYEYTTKHLIPLARRPLLDIKNSNGGYLLKEFCVIGYWDPRGGPDGK